ncbi:MULTISPECIES: hypothetical protein [Micromonospora]|uniref:Uncharacterized protein n=1 Tax=Micromonospora sicca TaxID=2202420 RepID=A0A317DMP1_9ACTN|nr:MULTISPECIES: hypothetical protein [unclassified Micromonospora]MBM0226766.1 hypothetical protein [Micromonospora sp. ATA51]PWR14053.1 hypothetical protein DKT69_18320 [Micromonospora sp. 4G51]
MQNQPGGAPPVFVDRTGRRRRLTVIAGAAMGLGLLTSLGLILAGLFFDSSVPLPGWSETRQRPPVEAGVDAPGEVRQPSSPSPRPVPVTSTSVPAPAPSPTSAGARATAPAPRASMSSPPGQGAERRTAKPSRTPRKP